MAIKARMTEMSNDHQLLGVKKIDADIESYLSDIGEVFRAFRDHDSGCTSFGVAVEGGRWFVKYSDVPIAIRWLRQAMHFNSIVYHKALPRFRHAFETDGGFALVYDWVYFCPFARRANCRGIYQRCGVRQTCLSLCAGAFAE